MFAFKNKYFFIIKNTKDINLDNIKFSDKFNIIYRNQNIPENINKISIFRKNCKKKKIDFYVSNNTKLAKIVKADGIYVSSYNKDLRIGYLKKLNFKIIGSAHNIKEIQTKAKQGCSDIIFSRLFKTSYANKKGFMGIIRFNLFKLSRRENLIPLGGIRLTNLNKLNIVRCSSIALSSEVKKKSAKILNYLF